jgi:hypothetical protein
MLRHPFTVHQCRGRFARWFRGNKTGDVVYIISKGGQSEEINQFARIEKEHGAVGKKLEEPGS